jgi:outer membrane protein assembly factor BamB
MGKTLALLFALMFLVFPCQVSKQASATFAANDPSPLNANLLWNYTTSNGVWSSPTIDNGVLYVGCEDVLYIGTQVSYAGNLYALNASNDQKLWNYSIPVGGSSPAVAEGSVYVGSFDNNFYSFNVTNGVKLWSYDCGDLVNSSPAVANGIVYIGLNNGDLCAFNGTTGTVVWRYNSDGAVGSPVVADGIVFAASNAFIPLNTFTGRIYALNASNGKLLWDHSLRDSVPSPTVASGIVYVGLGSNVSAFKSVDGSQLWNNDITKKQISLTPTLLRPSTILDNVLYVTSSDGNVYALNAVNGEKIWNHSLTKQIETSPAAAKGAVYTGCNDGNLYALNASNGKTMWNYSISDASHALESSPVIDNGIVYIGSGTHNIYAFGNIANSNASAYTLPIIIGAIIVVTSFTLTAIIMLKRLKRKPPQ